MFWDASLEVFKFLYILIFWDYANADFSSHSDNMRFPLVNQLKLKKENGRYDFSKKTTLQWTRKKRFPMNRLPLCFTLFASQLFGLLIVLCFKDFLRDLLKIKYPITMIPHEKCATLSVNALSCAFIRLHTLWFACLWLHLLC